MAEGIGDLLARLLLDSSQWGKGLTDASAQADDFAKKTEGGFGKLGDALGGVVAGIAQVGASLGLIKFGSDAMETARQVDKLNDSITRLNGPTEETTKLLEHLQELESSSPFEFEQLAPAAQHMLQLGASAETTTEALDALVDWGTAMHVAPEAIDAAATALAKMEQSGVATSKTMQALVAQNIPAWELLADKIGTDVPTAMDKVKEGAISAETVVSAVSEGLKNQFGGAAAEFVETWDGQMDQLAKNQDQAMEDIGRSLQQYFTENLLPALREANKLLQEFDAWWKNLDPSIRDSIITVGLAVTAFIGLAGAIGTVTSAWTLIEAAMAPAAATLGMPVVAIMALVAALALLGKWVYDNWTPIVATVKEAWSGIQELWAGIWSGIQQVLTEVWDYIWSDVSKIWNPINDFFNKIFAGLDASIVTPWRNTVKELQAIWDWLKGEATKIWESITKDVNKFIEIAQKIPGVKKLMNLDEVFTSTKKVADETKVLNDYFDELAGQMPKTGAAVKSYGNEQETAAGKTKKHKEESDAFGTSIVKQSLAFDILKAKLRGIDDDYQKAVKDFAEWRKKMDEVNEKGEQMLAPTEDLSHALAQIPLEVKKIPEAVVPALQTTTTEITNAVKKVGDLDAAFKSLGRSSPEQLQKIADEAKKHYETIEASGVKTPGILYRAWLEYTIKQVDATKATTGVIDEEYRKWLDDQRKALDDAEKNTGSHQKKTKSMWQQWGEDIQKSVSGFFTDIFKRLWEGSPENDKLDKQAAELNKSLADRAKEYDDFYAEIQQKQADATAKYEADLEAERVSLASALAERAKEYDRYVTEVAKNIADIKAEHAREAAEEIQEATDALDEKRKDYEDYAREIASNIDDIKDKWTKSYEDETQKLRDQLSDRTQDYEDYVQDVERKRDRLSEDTAGNIADESYDTQKGIRDKTKDYTRYAEDVATKIERLRIKNKGQNSDEEDDLRQSLARKKEDLDQYIADANAEYEMYVQEQKARQAREEEDLRLSQERKARDFAEYQADIATKQDDAYTKYQEGMNREVGAQEEALAKRGAALDKFATDTATKIEGITTKHDEAMNKEVTKQQESLDKQTEAYNTWVEQQKTKSEERTTKIQTEYEKTTGDLNTELAKQQAAYAQDVIDTKAKLDEVREAHRTLWDDIKGFGKSAIGEIGESLVGLASKNIMDSLFGGLFGDKEGGSGGSGGLGDFLGGIGGKLGGLLGKIPGLGKIFGGAAGGAASGGGGFLSSILGGGAMAGGPWGMVASAIPGIFDSLFGYGGMFGGQEKDADTLNKHTLETVNELSNLRRDEWDRFMVEGLEWDTTMASLNKVMDNSSLGLLKFDDLLTRTTSIYDYLGKHLGFIDDTSSHTYDLLQSSLRIEKSIGNVRSAPTSINVTATGVTTKEAATVLGNQIASNLTNQMVVV